MLKSVKKIWIKNKVISIIPLLVGASYLVSSGLAGTSGGRYLTPTSWTTILYFSIGIVVILEKLINNILHSTMSLDNLTINKSSPKTIKRIKISILVFLILLLFSMMVVPLINQEFRSENSDLIYEKLNNDLLKSGLSIDNTKQIQNNKDIIFIETVVFYPVINNNILTALALNNADYIHFYFPINDQKDVIMPHDARIICYGEIIKNNKNNHNPFKYFRAHGYAYEDNLGDWHLFEADQTKLDENLINLVSWKLR